jgi:hypothetical protein
MSTLPTPTEEDYCGKGGHFGPHNLQENRPGAFQFSELIFAKYQNAGCVSLISETRFGPSKLPCMSRRHLIASRHPHEPPRVIQTCDVFVDTEGLLYVTDYSAGSYVLEYKWT